MPTGYFITFEGLDGSGKTTQLGRLAETLRDRGFSVVTLRQPGGTPLGDRIRSMLVDSATDTAIGPIEPRAELGLMVSDRAQAIGEVIAPALAKGDVVLCDRFTDSSEAYQGAGRQLGTDLVLQLHRALCRGLQPDLTILLLPPIEASLHRARRRNHLHVAVSGTDENRFERESDAFYQRVYQAYVSISRREPERVVCITDDGSIDAIEARILALVTSRLPEVVQHA